MDFVDVKKHKQQQYYNNNKEKFAEAMKRYKEANAERLKEYSVQYYEKKKNQYTVCECGHTVKSLILNRHLTSKKHAIQLEIINRNKPQ